MGWSALGGGCCCWECGYVGWLRSCWGYVYGSVGVGVGGFGWDDSILGEDGEIILFMQAWECASSIAFVMCVV